MKEIVAAFIKNITLFLDKRVEVKWNFRDEWVQFVEEQQLYSRTKRQCSKRNAVASGRCIYHEPGTFAKQGGLVVERE